MIEPPPETRAFSRLGPVGAPSPVVIAVPHAGRTYPPAMLAAARLPRSALETIEDRYADLLIADAVAAGAVAIVARLARACVDLNRDPREIDATIVMPPPDAGAVLLSAKVTGGLGVVPSRIAAGGAVWRRPLAAAEVALRLATIHAPYHAAIATALDRAAALHGFAVLIDCHSMPPLPGGPSLVIGDRHGISADSRIIAATAAVAGAFGLSVARNRPYAGGYTLDRHGAPRAGRHAFQIEIDRALYLDAAQRDPGPGLGRLRTLVAAIATAAASGGIADLALAAE